MLTVVLEQTTIGNAYDVITARPTSRRERRIYESEPKEVKAEMVRAELVRREETQPSRIPEFKTRQEAADWFDTHDMADYQDEFTPVKVRVAKNLSEGITVRFDPEVLATIRTQAHEKGVGPTTLVRMWVLERLREQSGRPSHGAR